MNTSQISFRINDRRSGFVCKNRIYIESLQLESFEFLHEKTGAKYVHLANSDENNVFAVGFRTPPENSTGVAHILEHIVLAGSKKFPVKDPFFSMISRSLKTFMNAFTSSDWTMYPYATQNRKDFYNLMSIYLDAAFFPNLTKHSFLQEGVRLDWNEENGEEKLMFKGVVFNEMKGAMSTQQSLMYDALGRSLFPTLTYGKNSGGDPVEIPNLTHADLQDFHRHHYHPGNAWFYTYGNLAPEEHLDFIAENALKDFEPLDRDTSVPDEKRYSAPKEFTYTYPIDSEETEEANCQIAFAWLTCKITDTIENLSLSILEDILLGNSASPLRKALMESKLGKSLSDGSGYEDDLRETCFSIGLQGVAPENFSKVENLIFDTLKESVEKGLKQEWIDSAVHQFELSMREITGAGYPYGLSLLLRSFGSWMHGAKFTEQLDFDYLIGELKKKISEENYFESLIQKYLLDNPHRAKVILKGDPEHNDRMEQKLKEKLSDIEKSLSEEDRKKIREEAKSLEEQQSMKEDLSVLPKLNCEDIPKTGKEYPADRIGKKNERFYHQPVNGIFYALFRANLPPISPEKRFELPIILELLTKVGTKKYSYDDLALRISNRTGGISFGTSFFENYQTGEIREYLTLSGKSLNEKTPELYSLFSELMEDWSFHDFSRIRTLIQLIANSKKNGILPSGHLFSASLAQRKLSKTLGIAEMYQGISQTRFLQELAGLDEDSLRERLKGFEKQTESLLSSGYLDSCLIGDPQILQTAEKLGEGIYRNFSGAGVQNSSQQKNETYSDFTVKEIWTMSSAVSYVSRVYSVPKLTHPDSPALAVLAMWIESKILHREIREKGGAYGGMCKYDPEAGSFTFMSYRDPNLLQTWEAFTKVLKQIEEEELTEEDLEEALLKTFSRIDQPLSPAGKAFSDFAKKSKGLSEEILQNYRNKLLCLKKQELIDAANRYLNSEYSDAAITGKDLFEKDNLKNNYSDYQIRSIF